jgi:Fe-S-cluster containining protein
MPYANPCLSCGACCASFRVSFYWAEADDAPGGTVPAHLTEALTPHLRAMRGTSARAPHCVALNGTVGQRVDCAIYDQRPSPCREVMPGDPYCQRARARHGLPVRVETMAA